MFEVTNTEYAQFVDERAPFGSLDELADFDEAVADQLAEREAEKRWESPWFYAGLDPQLV